MTKSENVRNRFPVGCRVWSTAPWQSARGVVDGYTADGRLVVDCLGVDVGRRLLMDPSHAWTDCDAFTLYVASVQALAEQDGVTEPGKPYCDPQAWRGAWEDGMTPDEAWSDQKRAAREAGW